MLASLAVGMFRRLEDFLERLVEAPAGRLGVAPPQPVTLAKRIERAMDTNKRFSEGGVIVPNRYAVHLNPADYAPFDAYHGSLEDDLAHDALTRARKLGYRLVARPRVVLKPDPMVPRGEVRVAAAVADEEATPAAVPADPTNTSILARPGHAVPEPESASRAYLVVQTDGAPPARFDLGGALIAIGRAADNDVILDDPQVSRHHCQLKLQHGAYGFVDLQSRNGSTVNGRPVEEIALADGDMIRIGATSIEFRLRG